MSRRDDTPMTWDQRVLASLPAGVDPTLIAESLRLTPAERLDRLQAMAAFLDLARTSRDHPVPGPPPGADRG